MFDEDWGIEVDPNVEAAQIQEALMGIITGDWTVGDTVLKGARARSCAFAGSPTSKEGVIITIRGGREFALNIERYC